jgi:hypothetical protein
VSQLRRSFTPLIQKETDMSIRNALLNGVALLGLMLPVTGFCAGVDVCYTQATKDGDRLVVSNQALSPTAKLECAQSGKMSLSELRQSGWSVATVTYVGDHDPYNRTWMVVVQK